MDKVLKRASVQANLTSLENIKNIIAICSGKGGVGKSTVAVNLALAASSMGYKVGLLDADIYGPSIPTMLGLQDKPQLSENKQFIPLSSHNLQVMSFGLLVDGPTIWRGPMVSQALKQMVFGTKWQELDLLFVDLPPGTGDIQLTLAQNIPIAGVIAVTTPQKVAIIDCYKAIMMFKKLNLRLLGIVENMSYLTCNNCLHPQPLFGQGGGQELSGQTELPLLATLPFNTELGSSLDRGKAIQAPGYQELVEKLVATLQQTTTTSPTKLTINIEE